MKIPNFASVYHDGIGRRSSDSQFGSYRVWACMRHTLASVRAAVLSMLSMLRDLTCSVGAGLWRMHVRAVSALLRTHFRSNGPSVAVLLQVSGNLGCLHAGTSLAELNAFEHGRQHAISATDIADSVPE